jgi:Tol biopolymer transport system component
MKHRNILSFVCLVLLTILLLGSSRLVFAAVGDIERISIATDGTQATGPSSYSSVSGDGRYVAFQSAASNLVAGDKNLSDDIFVHDRQMNTTIRVSVSDSDEEANGRSTNPSISDDGRYVAFVSYASNLVANDTNGYRDIFLRDLTLNTTVRVSVTSEEIEANNNSYEVDISPDGNYVVFSSDATNLVAGDTNDLQDIFVRDMSAGTTTRVSISNNGQEMTGGWGAYNSSISGNGAYVAFVSDATNLVDLDTNGYYDVFVRDVNAATTTRVSVSSSGVQGNYQSGNGSPTSISNDGRFIAFGSSATNLVDNDTNDYNDIFVHDLDTGETIRVSVDSSGIEANQNSEMSVISGDGRYVAFDSFASNLVPGDFGGKDVFLYDTQENTITIVSVDSNGIGGDGSSYYPSISADGCFVSFYSAATNFVSDDINTVNDVFIKEVNASQDQGYSFFLPLFRQ